MCYIWYVIAFMETSEVELVQKFCNSLKVTRHQCLAVCSLEGRPVRWEEEDLAWTLTLEGGERYTHASEYNTKT